MEISNMKDRAEDYSRDEIAQFVDKETFSHVLSRVDSFLQSLNHNVMGVFGPKGIGKTLSVRIALHNKKFSYMNYFKTKKVPSFAPGEIVVIDDIHYIMDDIDRGILKWPQIRELLIDAIQYANEGKCKLILISEDSFTDHYIGDPEYRRCIDSIRFHELFLTASPLDVASFLNIKDKSIEMLLRKQPVPTPRGATRFLREIGATWEDIATASKTILSSEPELIPLFEEGQFPDVKKTGRKVRPIIPQEDWVKLFEPNKEAILNDERLTGIITTHAQGLIWSHVSEQDKSRIFEEKDKFAQDITDNQKKYFRNDIANDWDSEEAIAFIAAIFGEELYTDQGYTDEIRQIMLTGKNSRGK